MLNQPDKILKNFCCRPDCKFHKEFIEQVEACCPDAKITEEIGEGGNVKKLHQIEHVF